jgi:plastocyanin
MRTLGTIARLFSILGLAAPGALLADTVTVTLPVAASVVGAAPFFSDVRVFNTSYTDILNVTATYRCAPGSAGCATQPVKPFQLAPREAKAFDNICVSLFNVPNSLGAVEFVASSDELVVTSRLYSPASSPPWPAGTVGSVGMFIPGLESSDAHAVTVLTNLSNAGSATGSFRTNIGVYNPNPVAVNATIRLYNFQGTFPPVLLGTVPLPLSPRTGTQISNIYKVVGFENLVTTSGYATVESGNAGNPLFTYAATADNTTQDPVLVVGAADVAAPAGFHPPTPTTTSGAAGSSPTPTPTTASSGATRIVNVGASGNSFTDTVSGSGITSIHVGDTIKWVWMGGPHSTTSGGCSSGGYYGGDCSADGTWDSGTYNAGYSFSQKFTTTGTFHYFCVVHQASMIGTITVQP